MKKHKTLLAIMEELHRRVWNWDFIIKIDMKAGFHLNRLALGHEQFAAFRMKFGLYEYGSAIRQNKCTHNLAPRDSLDSVTITRDCSGN